MWLYYFDIKDKNKIFNPSIPALILFELYEFKIKDNIIFGEIEIFSKRYSIKYEINNNINVHELKTDLHATTTNKIFLFTINEIINKRLINNYNYQILNDNIDCLSEEIDDFHEDIYAKIIFYINNKNKSYKNIIDKNKIKYEFITNFGRIILIYSREKKYIKIDNKKIMFREMEFILNKLSYHEFN